MEMKKVKLSNSFHNTQTDIDVQKVGKYKYAVSSQQVHYIRDILCGSNDCTCSNALGLRGDDNEYYFEENYEPESGGILINRKRMGY
jgi:hypothetical protein